MKVGDRVKLKGRRVAATVVGIRRLVHSEFGVILDPGGDFEFAVILDPGGDFEFAGQSVCLEFDKPVRYNSSKTEFQTGWFDDEDCVIVCSEE
jgi:hypothetical protein